jgi:hypothetical protein
MLLRLMQLEHSKDVVAQAQAVVGLSGQLGSSSQAMADYIATVLAGVMRNPAVFCRCGAHNLLAAAVCFSCSALCGLHAQPSSLLQVRCVQMFVSGRVCSFALHSVVLSCRATVLAGAILRNPAVFCRCAARKRVSSSSSSSSGDNVFGSSALVYCALCLG